MSAPASDPSCIFCAIIRGEVPCVKIYEDDNVLAFLDLHPVRPGHTLVLPKTHAATLLELEPGSGEAVIQAMRKVGRAMRAGLGAEGFNCLQNNFAAAGQEVMHLHWHVIPRNKGDGLAFIWNPGKYADQDEMAAWAEKLGAHI
ncbi:MAG: HIT family protein [Deltaproteobacteria bacterium]|jgi:histidine triad (HIT) family protein|nr:HIT family protein [Deltaproteobacteria bacterium]